MPEYQNYKIGSKITRREDEKTSKIFKNHDVGKLVYNFKENVYSLNKKGVYHPLIWTLR